MRRRARQPRLHAPCVMTTGRSDPQIMFRLRDHERSRPAGLVPGTAVVEFGATMDLTGPAMREPAKKNLDDEGSTPDERRPRSETPSLQLSARSLRGRWCRRRPCCCCHRGPHKPHVGASGNAIPSPTHTNTPGLQRFPPS